MKCNHPELTPREYVAELIEMIAGDYGFTRLDRLMNPRIEKILTRLAIMDLFMMETEKENEFCEWVKRNLAIDKKENANG
ncbi:MAG: hypothetical protein HS129_15185 [Leptospiraceae bacterium]|nr:hypothetical protein [Leptospiraceae bacterium]NUM41348.1 hypothetical protein [Leptospiraceae bacterium]